MINVALSRRVGRVIDLDPLTRLDPVQRYELAGVVNAARDFSELPDKYQRLILEAEATRKRLIAERPTKASA